MLKLPIVFIHFGPAWYMKAVLKQATKFHDTVYLITDQDVKYDGVEVVQAKDYSEGVQEFTDVYKHMSTNAAWVEHICIVRWKMLLDLMKEKGHVAAIYLDSDVLIFDNLNETISKRIKHRPFGLSIPSHQPEFRWSASAHTSYITVAELEKLWEFMKAQYTEKEGRKRLRRKHAHHIKNKLAGGICDMTLLYLYAQDNELECLTRNFEGTTFDHNINVAENQEKDEYQMREEKIGLGRTIRIKDFQMVDGKPVVKNIITGEDVVFNSLHFQSAGGAKELIAKLIS